MEQKTLQAAAPPHPAVQPTVAPPQMAKAEAPIKKEESSGNVDFKIETSKLEVDDAMLKPVKHAEIEQPQPQKEKAKPKKQAQSQEPTSWQIETTVMDTDDVAPQEPKIDKKSEEKALTQKKAKKPVPRKEEEPPSFKIETTVATP